jgi:bla regulator protein BlaR1
VIATLGNLLSETALAGAAALLVVLALRLPLRHLCGARAAYALWLLVPAAVGAVLLPAPVLTAPTTAAIGAPLALAGGAAPAAAAAFDWTPWLLAAWALGTVLFVLLCIAQQRRFRRALGRLEPRPDGSYATQSTAHGPAVIGAWRGRIVLPADFDTRYTALERELVLRHERVHVARGDLAFNLAATAVRALHWFDPLVHYAVGRFRFDQELAADAAVLAQRPEARRPYADAMLKTQLHAIPPPLGCHWQSAHPLKERIAMLKRPLPGPRRFAAGSALVLALFALTGWTAWANQPARTADTAAAHESDTLEQASRRRMPPRYPVDALREKVEGTVVLTVSLDAQGKPTGAALDPAASSPGIDARLVAAAREAALGWEFDAPLDAQGRAQAGHVSVPITFSLKEDPQAALPIVAPGVVDAAVAGGPMPTYNRVVAPRYPKLAVAEKRGGRVLLRVLVGSDGLPQQVEVEASSGSEDLDASAVGTVRKWVFNAAHDGHKAVPVWVGVPIDFQITPQEQPDAPEGALEPIYIRA